MVEFPEELCHYGLNEALLGTVFEQVQHGESSLKWTLYGVPNNLFYQKLHGFLKKWPAARITTKVAIGKFYLAIDKNLGGRPDNVYKYIERVASVSEPDQLMSYGCATEVRSMRADIKHCTGHVYNMSSQVSELKQQLTESKKELEAAKCALRDVTNEKVRLRKQKDIAERRALRLRKLQLSLEEDISHLLEENTDLVMAWRMN